MRKKAVLIQTSIVGLAIFVVLSYFPVFFASGVAKSYGFPFEYLLTTRGEFEIIKFSLSNLLLELVISFTIAFVLVLFISLILMPFQRGEK